MRLPLRGLLLWSKSGKYRAIGGIPHLCPMCFSSQTSSAQPHLELAQKLLKVAIIGVPNSGKSTLINNLMARKVCPASNKVHTTRIKARAILTEYDTQLVFLDTPGLVNDAEQKRHKLENSFITHCEESLAEANVVGVVHDVSNHWTRERLDRKVLRALEKHSSIPSFLVLNKIDVLKSKRKLLDWTRTLTGSCLDGKKFASFKSTPDSDECWRYFSRIFMVSSLTGDGLGEIKNYLLSKATPSPWLFPEDNYTDNPAESQIVGLVRAKFLDFLPQEIPYQLKIRMEMFERKSDGSINTVVLVTCPSLRIERLVAGANEGRLRQITAEVEKDLISAFDEIVRIRIVLGSKEK